MARENLAALGHRGFLKQKNWRRRASPVLNFQAAYSRCDNFLQRSGKPLRLRTLPGTAAAQCADHTEAQERSAKEKNGRTTIRNVRRNYFQHRVTAGWLSVVRATASDVKIAGVQRERHPLFNGSARERRKPAPVRKRARGRIAIDVGLLQML